MLKKLSLLTVALMFLCCNCSIYAQNQRGTSTPEERKRAVDMATFLETNPLAKEAKDYRAKLLLFLVKCPT